MSVSKEDLFKKRVKQVEVDIPDVGAVTVRALTRAEVLKLGINPGSALEMDLAEAEQKLLSAAMVEPKMSQEDVKEWQENSPAAEINAVFIAVIKLSGLAAELPKEMVKQFPQ